MSAASSALRLDMRHFRLRLARNLIGSGLCSVFLFLFWLHLFAANDLPPRLSVHSLQRAPVTFSGRDQDVRVVLRSFADQAGLQLNLDPAISGRLSIVTRQSKLADSMEAICVTFNCSWQLAEGEPPSLVVTPLPTG